MHWFGGMTRHGVAVIGDQRIRTVQLVRQREG
jgi:hypothetical protein